MKIRGQTGFTIIELMVTIAVVAILAAIAVPGLQNILATSDLNAAQENFIQILNNGRGVAMSRSTIAIVSISGSTATLTVEDGSASAVSVTSSNRIAINEPATYTFNPFGPAAISSVTGTTVLSAPGFASIAPRTITVSPTGVVNVSR